eukprot:scaffold9713_cov103-Isochrysis_galbana.AAC.2
MCAAVFGAGRRFTPCFLLCGRRPRRRRPRPVSLPPLLAASGWGAAIYRLRIYALFVVVLALETCVMCAHLHVCNN